MARALAQASPTSGLPAGWASCHSGPRRSHPCSSAAVPRPAYPWVVVLASFLPDPAPCTSLPCSVPQSVLIFPLSPWRRSPTWLRHRPNFFLPGISPEQPENRLEPSVPRRVRAGGTVRSNRLPQGGGSQISRIEWDLPGGLVKIIWDRILEVPSALKKRVA